MDLASRSLVVFSIMVSFYMSAVPRQVLAQGCTLETNLDSATTENVGTAKASASLFLNALNSNGSLRKESLKLLHAALGKVEAATSEQKGKATYLKPLIKFVTSPDAFDPVHLADSYCNELLKKTTSVPIEFNNRSFSSLDAFYEWYQGLATGQNRDGKVLFKSCDQRCSPQYTTLLDKRENELRVDTKVICGPMRDHQKNQYTLEADVEWRCNSSLKEATN